MRARVILVAALAVLSAACAPEPEDMIGARTNTPNVVCALDGRGFTVSQKTDRVAEVRRAPDADSMCAPLSKGGSG